MKNLNFILAFLLLSNIGFAQKIIEKNIDYSNQSIEIDVKFANKIEVKTWDKSTVSLRLMYTQKMKDFRIYINLI